MLGIKVGQIQLGSYDKDTEFQMWVFVFKLAGFGKPLMVLNGRVTWSELLFFFIVVLFNKTDAKDVIYLAVTRILRNS